MAYLTLADGYSAPNVGASVTQPGVTQAATQAADPNAYLRMRMTALQRQISGLAGMGKDVMSPEYEGLMKQYQQLSGMMGFDPTQITGNDPVAHMQSYHQVNPYAMQAADLQRQMGTMARQGVLATDPRYQELLMNYGMAQSHYANDPVYQQLSADRHNALVAQAAPTQPGPRGYEAVRFPAGRTGLPPRQQAPVISGTPPEVNPAAAQNAYASLNQLQQQQYMQSRGLGPNEIGRPTRYQTAADIANMPTNRFASSSVAGRQPRMAAMAQVAPPAGQPAQPQPVQQGQPMQPGPQNNPYFRTAYKRGGLVSSFAVNRKKC